MEKCKPEDIQYMDYMPTGYGPEIEKYVIDDVFLDSRYIFIWRKKMRQFDPLSFGMKVVNQQYGYCTHCSKQFKTNELRHNMETQCPVCQSKCIAKDSGRGRQGLIAKTYFVFYERTPVNPQAMIARGIWAVRDYSGNFRKVVTQYQTDAFYIFEPGNSVMLLKTWFYSGKSGHKRQWGLSSGISSFFPSHLQSDKGSCSGIIYRCSRESIARAVVGTPFQYSTWESYNYRDMVRFFELFNQYPCIEYLTKLGLPGLVKAKLQGYKTYGAINWRGKTPQRVLRLSTKHVMEVRKLGSSLTLELLKLVQLGVKCDPNVPMDEISKLRAMFWDIGDLVAILKYVPLRRVRPYIECQFELKKPGVAFHGTRDVLTYWKDYIADCIALQMNLEDSRILYPKDLYLAHQDTIARISNKENELMDLSIEKRLPSLSGYYFDAGEFVIRPAVSTGELIAEGKALSICVGNYSNGYMTRYAAGQIVLLLIRRVVERRTSYFTMEVQGNRIVQVQGYKHRLPDEKLQAFIDLFKSECLEKKPKKRVVAAS